MKPLHGILVAILLIAYLTFAKSTTGTNPISATANQMMPIEKTTEQQWLESKPVNPTSKLVAKTTKPTSIPKKKKGEK